ncbi:Meckel syndrome type 1 protein isoform X3 [Betta splendens]|uniref:Meckel syndrome type 1 protein isoform X3 n=1 Tax=Betta splendens TaxID=158456 RepID=A0A9W2Y8V5_BETSP|nr:Meckel syndrome type 1 protein isoform X3 [Betta splendens]
MTDNWNTDTGEAVYRSRDAIKNLRIKVRIERVTSTTALSQHLQQQVLSQQDRGAIELETLPSQGHRDDNEEELLVGWQEKFFSQYEMELFQNEAACQTPLDRQYHTEVKALNRTKGRKNNRIFTYTDHDRYTNCLSLHQLQQSTDLLATTKASPTFLAQRMASVRHRRQDRRTMLGLKENECLLVTIKTDGNGTVILKPDFNKDKDPYRIVTEGEKKEVWRLTVENVSTVMKPEDKEREQNMYKDLYVRHKEYLNSLVGQDFEMPPGGILRFLMNGEIVSAKGFEYDNLYIHFFMELPNNWSSLPSQSLSGVTQTCRTKTLGKENVAFFSYPFTFETFYMSDKESDESVPQWPVLYFKVLSLDSWQRYRTEGYGYLIFPASPGKYEITCHTWRPLQTGTVSALRRFFIGGSPELEDNSYVRIPGTFKGERLSRLGFHTESTGSVTFNLHCIQQAKAFVAASMLKKRRQKVFDHLGGFSQQGAVCTILEAFQRARTKMQEARESLPRDLINPTSLSPFESSA